MSLKTVPDYTVLDMEENVDGSHNIAISSGDVFFLMMNLRDGADGVVYDFLVGRESGDKIDWLKETESIDSYTESLESIIKDVMGA